jgi:hypothetical protein
MTITAAQLRQDFPEFASAETYPDPAIAFWLNVAVITLPADRWDTLLPVGTELFVAHHLVLAAQAADDVAIGATPGDVTGPVTSKAVDKVSVSYDVGNVSLENGGFWNLSTYGIRFLQLARMIGAGPVQLGNC